MTAIGLARNRRYGRNSSRGRKQRRTRNKTCGYSTDAKPGSEALLEGQAGMNGSHLSRIIAPIVTTISLAARLILVAYAAGHPRWRARYVPRHRRSGKPTRAPGSRPKGNESPLAGDGRPADLAHAGGIAGASVGPASPSLAAPPRH